MRSVMNIETLMSKSEIGERNLVMEVADLLANNIDKETSDLFLNNKIIKNIIDLNQVVQRVNINRFFRLFALSYREVSNDPKIDVSGVNMYIIDDGEVEDWMSLVVDLIIPFFKSEDVIRKVDTYITNNS